MRIAFVPFSYRFAVNVKLLKRGIFNGRITSGALTTEFRDQPMAFKKLTWQRVEGRWPGPLSRNAAVYLCESCNPR